MKLKYIVPLVAFLGMAALLGVGLTLNPKEIPSTLIGKPAPGFELPVLTENNKSFSPNDLLGERWVLNVWASWCVSCRYEHPIFNQIADTGVIKIVGLNYKDKDDEAKQWLAERGNPYIATPKDNAGMIGINWGVIAVPETFIIDETGEVIYKHTGPITPKIVEQEMWPLFTGTSVSKTQ